MKGLILDDNRTLQEVLDLLGSRGPKGVTEWVMARDVGAFKQHLAWRPDVVSFDHDLGTFDADGNEIKGVHAALALVEWCHIHHHALPHWWVHSANPEGALNIASVLNTAVRVGHVPA